MNLIQSITKDPKQKHTVLLEDGTTFDITIEYKEQQYGWYITELVYLDILTVKGIQITNNYNILRQWANILPFGLACISIDDRESFFVEDFFSKASSLYVLTESELDDYEDFINL